MFTRVLLATDLSRASDEVICGMASLKSLGTRRVVLLHCMNIRDVGTLAETLAEELQPRLEQQKMDIERMGFEVETKMVLGLPHTEIIEHSRREHCLPIVVGSHGRSMVGDVLVGSVTSAVLHHATCPVLIVRIRVTEAEGGPVCEVASREPIRHVLFPTDFSDNAEHAFATLRKMVAVGLRHITLMHVQDTVRMGEHLRDLMDEYDSIDAGRLARMKVDLESVGPVEVESVIAYGSPVREIVNRAGEPGVSMVLMGSQGRGFIEELFLGSVSHNVTRRAPVSTMLIPAVR